MREQICQLVYHSSLDFKGSMTFSTVLGWILCWWKEEVSVLVLKWNFSKSASGVWNEPSKEGESWKQSTAMKGSCIQTGWVSLRCFRQVNGKHDSQAWAGSFLEICWHQLDKSSLTVWILHRGCPWDASELLPKCLFWKLNLWVFYINSENALTGDFPQTYSSVIYFLSSN